MADDEEDDQCIVAAASLEKKNTKKDTNIYVEIVAGHLIQGLPLTT